MSEDGNGAQPELPDGWEWKTLGALSDPPQYGYTTKAAPEGDLKFLRTTDISQGPINWEAVPYCSEPPADPDKYRLRTGDIVISRSGSVGLSALIADPPKSVFASYMIRFRPRDVETGQYLRLFMQSPLYWAEVHRRAVGIGMNNINAKQLAAIPVPYPPSNQQRWIVEDLSVLLTAISEGEKLLDRAVLLQEVFRSRVRAEVLHLGERNFPGTWSCKKLPEVAELSSGGTPLRSRPEYFGPDHPWVKIGDLTEGEVAATEESITAVGLINSSAELLPVGTVLLAMYGASIGRTGVLGVEASTNQAICAMRPRSTEITSEYLLLAVQASKEAFVAAGYGGAQPNISQRYLKDFEIPVPPLEEQASIARRVADMGGTMATSEAALTQAKRQVDRLRRSALSRGVSGDPVIGSEKGIGLASASHQ